MSAHDLILFDLDGTLSDPLVGIGRSINYALEYFGFAPLDLVRLAPYVGPPIDETFTVLTGVSSDADIRALVAKYRERYSDVGYSENVLYPDVADAIAHLADADVPLGICTSKREDFADRILQMFGLRAHFAFVSGGEVGIAKWQQIEALVAAGRVGPATLMVGDRATDLIAAHRNGLLSAGVLWGYGSEAELAQERPHYVFRTAAELKALAR
jgi:phosphoglycolate phosphatase